MDHSPVGAPVFQGQGVKPPTGGGSFSDGRAATDAVFAELGGASGSLAASGVRGMEGQGLFEGTPGYEASGAAMDAAFAELGSSYAYEYCFRAGTPVFLADGSLKRIDEIQPGEILGAKPAGNVNGRIDAKPVLRVFHNRPARLFEVEVAGGTISTTPNHPFYVRNKGFVHAENLQPGDELHTHDNAWTPVTATRLTDHIEPVYNLEVADHHTYFVAGHNGGPAVLVHNQSPDPAAEGEAFLDWFERHNAPWRDPGKWQANGTGACAPSQNLGR